MHHCHGTPNNTRKTTHHTKNHRKARTCSDTALWAGAHGNELDKLEIQKTFRWIHKQRILKSAKIISLKIKYWYKHEPSLKIERKARCLVRDDRMKPYLRFDPNHTSP